MQLNANSWFGCAWVVGTLLGPGCAAGGAQGDATSLAQNLASAPNETPRILRYQPQPWTSWQYQLSGALEVDVEADLFDIDLFETSAQQVATLHARGRRVICYFDTAYEPDRPDSAQLSPHRGKPVEGWPGQFWLDVRAKAVVDTMVERIALAAAKGCDGVEADDVDSVDNDPGFPITHADQQAFVLTLARAAHAQRLAFGLKNALQDIPALVDHVDFAINESCLRYRECASLAPFVSAKLPVFHVEYTEDAFEPLAQDVCPRARDLHFQTIIKHRDLDAAGYPCR